MHCNSEWQRDLSVSQDRIDAILQAQGDLAGALKDFQAGMVIRERLTPLDPGNSAWQHPRISERADSSLPIAVWCVAAQVSQNLGRPPPSAVLA